MLETSTIHWPYQTHISKLPKLPYSFSSSNVPHSHSHSLNCNLSSHFKLCRSRYCTYLLFLSLQPSSIYLTLSLSLLCSNSLSFTFYISHTNTHLLLYVAHTPSLSLSLLLILHLSLSLSWALVDPFSSYLYNLFCAQTLSHALTHTHCLSRYHPHSYFLSAQTLNHSLFTLSTSHTNTHYLSLSPSLSLTHTFFRSLFHAVLLIRHLSLSLSRGR